MKILYICRFSRSEESIWYSGSQHPYEKNYIVLELEVIHKTFSQAIY